MYKDVSGVKITEVTEEEVYPTREVEVRDISRKGVSSSEHIVQGGADEVSLESGHRDVQELTSDDAARTSLSNYQLARDRSRRHTVPPVRFSDYDCTEDEVAFTLYIAEVINVEEPRDFLKLRQVLSGKSGMELLMMR